MSATMDALNGGGKRVRIHNAQMVVKMPEAAKDLIRQAAKDNNVSEATIVRWALGDYFDRRGLGK